MVTLTLAPPQAHSGRVYPADTTRDEQVPALVEIDTADKARVWVDRVLAPLLGPLRDTAPSRDHAGAAFPRALHVALADTGLYRLLVPERHGGLGGSRRALGHCQKSRRAAGSSSCARVAPTPPATFHANRPSSSSWGAVMRGWPPGSNGPRVGTGRDEWATSGYLACLSFALVLAATRARHLRRGEASLPRPSPAEQGDRRVSRAWSRA